VSSKSTTEPPPLDQEGLPLPTRARLDQLWPGLRTSVDRRGEREAARRRAAHAPNVLRQANGRTWALDLGHQLTNPRSLLRDAAGPTLISGTLVVAPGTAVPVSGQPGGRDESFRWVSRRRSGHDRSPLVQDRPTAVRPRDTVGAVTQSTVES
jgi:hypothetical protein